VCVGRQGEEAGLVGEEDVANALDGVDGERGGGGGGDGRKRRGWVPPSFFLEEDEVAHGFLLFVVLCNMCVCVDGWVDVME
jgi:hypothetical protein